jgi:predicted DNA-binding transcriptional regulator AlpA
LKKLEAKKVIRIENPEDRLLTIDELAARWSMKPASIYCQINRKVITVVHIGRAVRFRLSDILKLERVDEAI